jgi:hypothetical protein
MRQGEPGPIIPVHVLLDLARVVERMMTRRRHPESEARIRARAEQMSQDVPEEHGVPDIGVPDIPALGLSSFSRNRRRGS